MVRSFRKDSFEMMFVHVPVRIVTNMIYELKLALNFPVDRIDLHSLQSIFHFGKEFQPVLITSQQ